MPNTLMLMRAVSAAGELGRQAATGDALIAIGRDHIGERYVLGARAPMADASWKGPWDCAEFVSWCVYQTSGMLFGVYPKNDPVRADAYTGYWYEQALAEHALISVEEAARTTGACLLRVPAASRIGHIAFSDGKGKTVEAHSAARGVSSNSVSGRRWDYGVLVPGINYFRSETAVDLAPTPEILRLTQPMTRGSEVKILQRRLRDLGYFPGTVDGIYGPQTAAAVQDLQIDAQLVPDGELGPATAAALKTARRRAR